MSDYDSVPCSIIIRCYNEEQHIGRLLTGIAQQTVRDPEIIVVDSGSTDATTAIAARYPTRIMHISPEEFSFGRSLNLGCAAARGEILVMVSAHCYPVFRDWLEKLLAPFADPQVGLSYGRQRGDGTTKFSEGQILARWFPDVSNLNQQHPFSNNANAAVRHSLWMEMPYDETLTGLEDVDWARRVMSRGHKVAYVADADIIHAHDERFHAVYNRYRREALALKRIFPEQHFSLWDFVRLFTGNVFSDCVHARREGVLWRNLRSILGFRLMQFWGTHRGFAQPGGITMQLRETFYYPQGLVRARPPAPERDAARRVEYAGRSQAPQPEAPAGDTALPRERSTSGEPTQVAAEASAAAAGASTAIAGPTHGSGEPTTRGEPR